ncbi:MAG TPA: hypothetical protein DEP23_00360, partial [Ruminococcaceae bacterium]|nr:hypothetical protein [Oscillospiraceae bacterium]
MRLLLLDGNSIVNRAFYGIKLLTTKNGQYTNGLYGFLLILHKLREELQPDGIAAAFDLRAPTFRHQEYAEYKAGRGRPVLRRRRDRSERGRRRLDHRNL